MADAPKIIITGTGKDSLRTGSEKINQAIDNANTALTTANTAKSTADTAKSTADTALANSENTQTQLDTIVINGDSSVEAAQARVAADGTTYTTLQDRLNSSDAQLAKRPTQKQVASISSGGLADKIATVADFASGEVVVAVASDSTANDGNDWVFSWLRLLAATLPSNVGVKHIPWDNTNQVWKSASIIKEGATIPASGGVIIDDTFTRTGETVGSTSDNGKVWTGTTGIWTMDGDSVSSNGSGALSYNVGSKSAKATVEFDVKTATTAIHEGRVYIGSSFTGMPGDGVWAQFSISTTGIPNLALWKRINGVNTNLVTADYSLPLTANTATLQKVTLTIEVSIQQVSMSITTNTGTKSYNASITESDYNYLGNYVTLTGFNQLLYAVLSTKFETPYTPEQYTGITVYNGAVAGTKLDYQLARVNTMFPSNIKLDGLLVAGGHNYASDTPEAFLSAFDTFIQSFLTNHPNALIAVSSQNPQFSPSATIIAHAIRQAAVRSYAKEKQYDYIPAFEAFKKQSDSGASLVLADGVHPSTPPIGTTPDGYGSVLWAKTWQNIIDLHRVI